MSQEPALVSQAPQPLAAVHDIMHSIRMAPPGSSGPTGRPNQLAQLD